MSFSVTLGSYTCRHRLKLIMIKDLTIYNEESNKIGYFYLENFKLIYSLWLK